MLLLHAIVPFLDFLVFDDEIGHPVHNLGLVGPQDVEPLEISKRRVWRSSEVLASVANESILQVLQLLGERFLRQSLAQRRLLFGVILAKAGQRSRVPILTCFQELIDTSSTEGVDRVKGIIMRSRQVAQNRVRLRNLHLFVDDQDWERRKVKLSSVAALCVLLASDSRVGERFVQLAEERPDRRPASLDRKVDQLVFAHGALQSGGWDESSGRRMRKTEKQERGRTRTDRRTMAQSTRQRAAGPLTFVKMAGRQVEEKIGGAFYFLHRGNEWRLNVSHKTEG